MNSLIEIADVLKKAQTIAVMGHMNPDGDCLGSTLAAGLALKKIGKDVSMICVDNKPDMYDFLPGYEELQVVDQVPACDVLLMVDCTDTERVGDKLKHLPQATIVNIDHHISNKEFGQYNYIQSKASATGEIIYELIKTLDIEITEDIAQAIYVAIVMDTGSFKYSNTSAHTHSLIGELIEKGINVGNISTCLFENKEITGVKVLAEALKVLSFSEDNTVSWMVLDYPTLQSLKAKDEHIDDVINYSRMIKGVEVGILFRELEPENVKVSLRSKQYVDVNQLAALFGGGGHARAAGCRLTGKIDEKVKEVVAAAVKAVHTEKL